MNKNKILCSKCNGAIGCSEKCSIENKNHVDECEIFQMLHQVDLMSSQEIHDYFTSKPDLKKNKEEIQTHEEDWFTET